MKIMKLTKETLGECVAAAAEVLKNGGVILYPTDTLYGLGADALSDAAVAKIYAIKGRPDGKPIHAIVSDMAMAKKYAIVTEIGEKIARNFFPGPLTLILKKKSELHTGVAKDIATFAIRIPNQEFCLALARECGIPFTATSANKSGMPPERTLAKILAQLGPAIRLIDIAFEAGELPPSLPSTVVDVSNKEIHILREGAISPDKILSVK